MGMSSISLCSTVTLLLLLLLSELRPPLTATVSGGKISLCDSRNTQTMKQRGNQQGERMRCAASSGKFLQRNTRVDTAASSVYCVMDCANASDNISCVAIERQRAQSKVRCLSTQRTPIFC